MRVILQRVLNGNCEVEGSTTGSIRSGLVALVGFTHKDTDKDLQWMTDKIINLRIFEDKTGKMNHSLLDIEGEILSISQFTLYGECRKGRRPNFMNAAPPETAEPLYHAFNKKLSENGVNVKTGEFGKMMNISLTNNGPVTLVLDSPYSAE
ncbi:D-aminoacyl-tRNA deacylase [Alteribacillus sp. HJP-4]|uniref:D-aminoacyl-tRNA deacylase n=1 Tax=Alteribacillus sp. HJP-4 TaxID=2775394 RepID=UPI0035CCCB3D